MERYTKLWEHVPSRNGGGDPVPQPTSQPISQPTPVSLQNPSFESPPINVRTNASTQFVLLNTLSKIPGWSFQGTVWYVTSGNGVSLPGNGHGLQLGPNGMISQTFIPDGSDDYVLTFTLAPSSPSCANDATAITVSGPSLSKVFFYKQSLGKETWQTYAYAFWRNSISLSGITLQIQSVTSSSRSNSACWPIIDELLLTGIKYPRVYGDFIMGDAGDSCVGDLAVVVQVGTQKWRFAMRSNGLGSSQKYRVKFNAAYSPLDAVPISFSSFNQTRTSDNQVLCGPVTDGMFVRISSGLRSTRLHYGLVIFVMAVTYSFFA